MTMNVTTMIQRVRKPLGMTDPTDPDLSDSDVELYLNNAFWEVQDKFPFREKEVTSTFPTIAATIQYSLPTPFEALRQLAVINPESLRHHKLDKLTPEDYESRKSDNTWQQGMPRAYLRESNYILLWPTPDQVYTIVCRRNQILADLDESTNPNLVIPQVWEEIVVYGAVWRAFIDLGDIARANAIKAHQVSLINSIKPVEEKEMDDTHHDVGLQVWGRDFDQRDRRDRHIRSWE